MFLLYHTFMKQKGCFALLCAMPQTIICQCVFLKLNIMNQLWFSITWVCEVSHCECKSDTVVKPAVISPVVQDVPTKIQPREQTHYNKETITYKAAPHCNGFFQHLQSHLVQVHCLASVLLATSCTVTVHQLQACATAARIQYCHLFHGFVHEGIYV